MFSGCNLFIGFKVEKEGKIKETQVTKTKERLMCLKGDNFGTLKGTLAFRGFKDAHLNYHSVNLFNGNLYK